VNNGKFSSMTSINLLVSRAYELLPSNIESTTDKNGTLWVEKNGLPLDKER
jgi:hypothetical protein